MTNICEHELKKGTEYDLYAKLDLTIAWDKFIECFVLKKISNDKVEYRSKELDKIVEIANNLEGAKNTEVACGSFCTHNKRG